MALRNLMLTFVFGLTTITWSNHGVSQVRPDENKQLQGLWRGSWGGGERHGTVFQPVIAEMVIEGDQVELRDFPQVQKLLGTIRMDAANRKLRLVPQPFQDNKPALQTIEYTFELAGDKLTLREGEQTVELQKLPVVTKPLANVQVELVTATGFNEAGDLLVNRVTTLQANATGATYYQSEQQTLSTKQAKAFVVEDKGLKTITLEAARPLVRKELPVVVALRQDDQPPQPPAHELWKDIGSAPPDSEAALQTYARLLRPGTVVFILSARENIPRP